MTKVKSSNTPRPNIAPAPQSSSGRQYINRNKLRKPHELLRRVFKAYKELWFSGQTFKSSKLSGSPLTFNVELERSLMNEIVNHLYGNNTDFQKYINQQEKHPDIELIDLMRDQLSDEWDDKIVIM